MTTTIFCSAQNNSNLQKDSLLGPVKSIKEKYSFGTDISLVLYDKDGYICEEYEYYYRADKKNITTSKLFYKKGKLVKSRAYDVTGSLTGKSEYIYDDGHLVERSSSTVGHFLISISSSYITRYTLDEKFNILEARRYDGIFDKWFGKGTPIESWKYKYIYDGRNNLIELLKYDGRNNDELVMKITYKYDDNNSLIEKIDYNWATFDNLDTKTIYKYDGDKIVEKTIQKEYKEYSVSSINQTIFIYSDDGILLEKRIYTNGERMYKHDENYRVIGMTFAVTNTLFSAEKYDKYGNVMERSEYIYNDKEELTKTTIFKYNYEYDKWGNWIKQFRDYSLLSYREIAYYK